MAFFGKEKRFKIVKTFLLKDFNDLDNFCFFLFSQLTIGEEKNFFVALSGEIGSGKTTLIKKICSLMKVRDEVNSPTFNIMNRYWSHEKKCFLNHFDFFKMSNKEDFSIFDDFKNESINLIEWAENAPSFWINEKKLIYLKIDFLDHNLRKISVFTKTNQNKLKNK